MFVVIQERKTSKTLQITASSAYEQPRCRTKGRPDLGKQNTPQGTTHAFESFETMGFLDPQVFGGVPVAHFLAHVLECGRFDPVADNGDHAYVHIGLIVSSLLQLLFCRERLGSVNRTVEKDFLNPSWMHSIGESANASLRS